MDETKMNLYQNDGKDGEHDLKPNTLPVKHHGGSVMS